LLETYLEEQKNKIAQQTHADLAAHYKKTQKRYLVCESIKIAAGLLLCGAIISFNAFTHFTSQNYNCSNT